jgi:hypothetical protein
MAWSKQKKKKEKKIRRKKQIRTAARTTASSKLSLWACPKKEKKNKKNEIKASLTACPFHRSKVCS